MKKEIDKKHRILVIGASGFIGEAIYKELCSYFRTFGTYRTDNYSFDKNQHYFQYNVEEDDIFEILEIVKPTIIISSYENDKTLSHSMYGHFKIKIENMLLRLHKRQIAILRLPMVFGALSPRIQEIKAFAKEGVPIEIFPNLIMNVTTDTKVTQQIHYIINRNKSGVFHLGSIDLVHHDDFIKEIIVTLGITNAKYKQVFTTNNDRYLAVLPKENKLPKHLQISSRSILKELES